MEKGLLLDEFRSLLQPAGFNVFPETRAKAELVLRDRVQCNSQEWVLFLLCQQRVLEKLF